MSRGKFFLTTAIDYPNSRPHIGTAFEKIGADVQARYRRQQGYDVRLLMGNDENTIKVVERAEALGLEPKPYVDDMARQFREVWDALEISYDDFIQTSEERHRIGCQQFIQRVYDAGDIYKKNYEALYCEGCEEFKTESQLNAERRCPNHPQRDLKLVQEENYFFRLSKYGPRLLEHYAAHPEFIQPESRRNEIVSLVKSGLEDISISRRDFTWGIDIPWDAEHKIYVWFDALLNYITGIGYGTDPALFARYWPADVHFIGKDITRFHCALWPAMLWSAGVELPRQVFAHGFVYLKNETTDEVQKISKSLGNVIEPLDIVRKFSSDAFRYYFMRECPFGGDGEFSFTRFAGSYNGDLANNLGNLFSRTVSMALRYFEGQLAGSQSIAPEEIFAGIDLPAVVAEIAGEIEDCRYAAALELIWRQVLDTGNRYIEEQKPWLLASPGKPEYDLEACRRVMVNLAEGVRVAAILVKPFLPDAAAKLYAGFNYPTPFAEATFATAARRPVLTEDLRVTAPLTDDGKVTPLFPKIDLKAEPAAGKK
ncbi:MAG: methionine--tRNA ligase [Planctomycetaceae bacterium]|nr:methionine--tRNA ligase [Planctomycetaceae bacterium]